MATPKMSSRPSSSTALVPSAAFHVWNRSQNVASRYQQMASRLKPITANVVACTPVVIHRPFVCRGVRVYVSCGIVTAAASSLASVPVVVSQTSASGHGCVSFRSANSCTPAERSAMHSFETSMNLRRGWLADQLLKAMRTDAAISSHVLKSKPQRSSPKSGSRMPHIAGSHAYVMPPSSPPSSSACGGRVQFSASRGHACCVG